MRQNIFLHCPMRNMLENVQNPSIPLPAPDERRHLSVGLGNTLQLILLLDGVGVGGSLGGVDKLLSEALSNGLDVAESGLTGTDGKESDGLVDTAEWGDIDGLATDGSGRSNASRILTWSAVDNGVNANLDWVLVGHDVNLVLVLVCASCDPAIRVERTISKAWATMRTAMSFFPLLRPFIIKELVRRSMIGHWALRKRLAA